MANNITVTINENPPLISSLYIERAKLLSSSVISDAMNGFGTMDYKIKPMGITKRIIGTALTVNLRPGDNLMLHKAIYLASAGYVLVADGKEDMRSAGWGDMMTRSSMERGIEGVVLDGVVRDIADLNALDFPVFAKGAIPSGINKNGPGEINTTISCCGVHVNPGDLIVGDEDGVVVIPSDDIEAILLAAEAKLEKDNERVVAITKRGNPEPTWISDKLRALEL